MKPTHPDNQRDRRPEHLIDIETLSRTALREKYKKAYSSWSNMKQRVRQGRAILAPEFADFAEFLRHVGPPGDGQTIDKIDHTNPVYGPGLVRWLDRKGQANNRSTTIPLTIDGVSKPLTAWAEETAQKPATLRDRHRRGLSDREVVYPRRGSAPQAMTVWYWKPWEQLVVTNPDVWEQQYQNNGRERELPSAYFFRVLREKESALDKNILRLIERDGQNPSVEEANYIESQEKQLERIKELIEEAGKILSKIRKSQPGGEYADPPFNWVGPSRHKR
ncbi:MAG: hypothetical protein VYD57_08245 [Pseudomonadota bacterium]|nr:hypothetical protein [Pseudomonadota bacterium]